MQVTALLCRLESVPPLVPIKVTTLFGDGDEALEPDGRVSANVTRSPRVIGSGPLFVTVMVHPILPPALTVATEAVLVTVRSYTHGSQSMLREPLAPAAPRAGVAPAVPDTAVGDVGAASGDDARKLEPPPPPAPVRLVPTVAAPPPPPVYPAPPPPAPS